MFSVSFDPHVFATSTQCLLLRAGCCGKGLFIPKSILLCPGNSACIEGASERVHVTKLPAWSLYEAHHVRCPLSCIYQNSFHIKTHLCESPPCVSSKGNLIMDGLLAASLCESNVLRVCMKSLWYFTLTDSWLVPTCLLLYSSWAISWKRRRALFFYKHKWGKKRSLLGLEVMIVGHNHSLCFLSCHLPETPRSPHAHLPGTGVLSLLCSTYGWELTTFGSQFTT